MIIKLLEGYFNNPEQARKKKELEKSKSAADRLSATATNMYNTGVLNVLNEVISKYNISIFPTDLLSRQQYFSLERAIERPQMPYCFTSRTDNTKIERVNYEGDKLELVVRTNLDLTYSEITSDYSEVKINVGYIERGVILREDDMDLYKKYFVARLKCSLKHEVDLGHFDEYGKAACDMLESKVIINKINLYDESCKDLYLVPAERVKVTEQDGFGTYLPIPSTVFEGWTQMSIFKAVKRVCECFNFCNTDDLYFKHIFNIHGEADMKILNSPKISKYCDNFIETVLSLGIKKFYTFLDEVSFESSQQYNNYKQITFNDFATRKERMQIARWMFARENALKNKQYEIEKVEREIVIPKSLLHINKETGDLTAQDDFTSIDQDVTVIAHVHIKLAGIKETIAARMHMHVANGKHVYGDENTQSLRDDLYTTDMGVNTLKLGEETIEGMRRTVQKFPGNPDFPWLPTCDLRFTDIMLEQISQREYFINRVKNLSKEDEKELFKVGSDFADILYYEATESNEA